MKALFLISGLGVMPQRTGRKSKLGTWTSGLILCGCLGDSSLVVVVVVVVVVARDSLGLGTQGILMRFIAVGDSVGLSDHLCRGRGSPPRHYQNKMPRTLRELAVSKCCGDSFSKVSGCFPTVFSFTLAFERLRCTIDPERVTNPVTNACPLKSSQAKPRLELQAESLDREPVDL